MARCRFRYTVRLNGVPVTNAKVYFYTDSGATTATTDVYDAASSGSLITYGISNDQGEVIGFKNSPGTIYCKVTDNSQAAYIGLVSNIQHWADFVEQVEVYPVGAEVAQKPDVGDAIQYATQRGNDDNDGLSWGSAKLTVLAAYDDLPADGGTIYYTHGTAVGGEVADQGLWLRGSGSVVGGALPAGWREEKRLALIGVGGGMSQQLGAGPPASQLVGGHATNTAKPLIWLAGTQQPKLFERVGCPTGAVAIPFRAGVDTDGTTRTANTAGWLTRDCLLELNQVTGTGPSYDLGYVFFCGIQGGSAWGNEVDTLTNDNHAAVLVKGANGVHLSVRNLLTGRGGVRFYTGSGSWYLKVDDLLAEGYADAVLGRIQVPAWISGGSQFGVAELHHVRHADSSNNPATIQNDDVPAECIVVTGVDGQITGPVTYGGGRTKSSTKSSTTHPARGGGGGLVGGVLVGQHDAVRRAFSPAAARAANLAAQDVSTWSGLFGSATVTTGKLGPDGLSLAALLSGASQLDRQPFRGNRTFAVGDYVIAGVWARSVNGGTLTASQPVNVILNTGGNTFVSSPYVSGGVLTADVPFAGDGDWQWIYAVGKISATSGGACDTAFKLQCDATHSFEYYLPVFCHIDGTTISENEATLIATHASAWADGVGVGVVGTTRGQKLLAYAGLAVGNSAAATTPGTVTKKMQVFDAAGNSLGYVPIYDAIT